jgi:hypothetical protein
MRIAKSMCFMTRVISVIAVLVMMVPMGSCRTVDKSEIGKITIPKGLGMQDVKLAILLAASPQQASREWTPAERMTDNALKAAFPFYQKVQRQRRWFPEEITPNSVILGYDNGKHYFRIEYAIEQNEIFPKVVGSRNLSESESRIHKSAIEWIGSFESEIRRQLGRVSLLVEKENAVPLVNVER